MARTVLGLDLGSYTVKAALYDTTFRSYDLTDLFESTPLQLDDVAPEDRSVVYTEALIRMISENGINASTVVTGLSGVNVSTRIITLPLPAKQIEKVLPFELESHLPFDMEEVLVDAHIIHSTKSETTCLAAAVQKSVLAEHLALLRSANLEPSFVTLDALSLVNLNQLTHVDWPGTFALINIGHHTTSICVISEGAARYTRTLFTAGAAITDAIRDELDLTLDQANEVKQNHGILELETHPLKSKDLRRLSGAIRTAVDPLIREVLQTFHSYRAQYAQKNPDVAPIERVYLTGGTSLLRNLPEYMRTLTSLPTSRLDLFPEHHPVSEKLGTRQPLFAQAVAYGLRASARGTDSKRMGTLNFRKGEFAFARSLGDLRDKVTFFAKWMALIFILALVQVGFRYSALSREHSKVEKTILDTFRQIVPDEKKPPKDSAAALLTIKERMRKFQSRQEVLTAGLNEVTALGILRDISDRIPRDLQLDAQELSIDRNKVTLRGHTDSIAAVDRIMTALSQKPEFKNIEKGDIREGPDGKKVFNLTITIGGSGPTAEKEVKKK